jgi:hypothetical protein
MDQGSQALAGLFGLGVLFSIAVSMLFLLAVIWFIVWPFLMLGKFNSIIRLLQQTGTIPPVKSFNQDSTAANRQERTTDWRPRRSRTSIILAALLILVTCVAGLLFSRLWKEYKSDTTYNSSRYQSAK